MDAMTILKRCREANTEIGRLKQLIGQRYDALTAMGVHLDPNGGSRGGSFDDKTARICADIDGLERQLQKRTERKNAELAAVTALMDMLPDLEGMILYKYYAKRMSCSEIAREDHYQSSYIRKRKRAGEDLLAMLRREVVEKTLPAWYLREEEA